MGMLLKNSRKAFFAICSIVSMLIFTTMAESREVRQLKFKSDKSFKIVQFTDTQDDQNIDPRTVNLIEAVCDVQQPDLVVFTGDNVTSGPRTVDDVKRAIDNFVRPVNNRGIPWFITFGNHDEDHTPYTGMDKAAQLKYYMSYSNNIRSHLKIALIV
jgi:predicted MPP superfamily phosphohydrolase